MHLQNFFYLRTNQVFQCITGSFRIAVTSSQVYGMDGTVNLTKTIPPSKIIYWSWQWSSINPATRFEKWGEHATNELLGRKELEVANVPSHTLLWHHPNYQPPVELQKKKQINIQANDCIRDLGMLIYFKGFISQQFDIEYRLQYSAPHAQHWVNLRAAIPVNVLGAEWNAQFDYQTTGPSERIVIRHSWEK